MLISVGANTILANRSQNMQKTAPPKKQAGIMTIGFAVRNSSLTICGTAIPTKDTGPANAVTTADKMLDSTTRSARNSLIFTPIFFA